ncbi:MAG TPA: DUF3108 domain-containing protein [Oxalicibacterium sp.]|jgi:hypothetical protein|nr:DUF3108 domain-containing protein [Oxalicibacterium sp.]
MISIRTLPSLLFVGLLALQPALAQNAAKNAGRKIDPAPSADLDYTITATQKGLTLNGSSHVHWHTDGKQYAIATETRASLLGKILDAKSEGAIDRYGLAPNSASEKRFRKEQTTTTFDRSSGKITFSASDGSYPIKGGEQDRNSVTWQLVALARGNNFKTGNTVSLIVAGQKDADPWTFKIGKQEKISTPLGSLNAVPLTKIVKDAGKDQKVELWLAPGKEWYPVRLRFTEPDGDTIEQTISKISPAQ